MTATAFAGAVLFLARFGSTPIVIASPLGYLGLALGIMMSTKYHGLLFAVMLVAEQPYYLPHVGLCSKKTYYSPRWCSTLFTGGPYYLQKSGSSIIPRLPFGGHGLGRRLECPNRTFVQWDCREDIKLRGRWMPLPFKMSFWVTDGTMNDLLGPLWLFLFPVAIIARPWPTTLRFVCLRPVGHVPMWAFSNAKVRYFAPLWLLLFWLCGWAWSYLKDPTLYFVGPSVK